jgi:hypothetical protein
MKNGRKIEILKAFLEDDLKKKGLQFRSFSKRDTKREVKDFNLRHPMAKPMTVAEILEIYLEVMGGLVGKHLDMVRRKIKKYKNKKG